MLKNLNLIVSWFRNHYAEIYKSLLFVATVVFLVALFPVEGKFKYEFQKGKPWMHDDLIAPFDFAILKSTDELKTEEAVVLQALKPYFKFAPEIGQQGRERLLEAFETRWQAKYQGQKGLYFVKAENRRHCIGLFDTLMQRGVIEMHAVIEGKDAMMPVVLISGNVAQELELGRFFTVHQADEYIRQQLPEGGEIDRDLLLPLMENALVQNVVFDSENTEKEKVSQLEKISLTHGMVQVGERIISKGELITGKKYQLLESMRFSYEKRLGATLNYRLVRAGQVILVSISMVVFMLYLFFFRKDIFRVNKKILLLLLLTFLMVLLTSLTVKYQVGFLYIVPVCMAPIMVRAFFDSRLALFTHIITVIVIGFLVPNSFEFVFLQLIAGIITIISVVSLQRRAQFFLTSLLIFLTYSAIYTGMLLIQDGSVDQVDPLRFGLFAGSAVLTMFAYPLIYLFEKLFGLVTDVTLMELSDTNSKLLRELSRKAPGTFQHSLQVSNLAEEAIFAIGGNALLVRTGALYHDIGKMDNALYFTENQVSGINPHDELSYIESARVIIDHVIEGVEKARKHKLPEQLIDFIRTHHGLRKTEYFYSMQKRDFPEEPVDEDAFTYHGPVPYSKETAVLMMADSVEAASRSLKIPDEQKIHDLVDGIINRQLESGQFINADITLREIQTVKRVLMRKLMNIYHVRIEYPE